MDYGLCLPNFPDGSTPEGIDAAAALAERLGWSTVWTTDHVLVPTADAGDYARIYDALMTLAWVAARHHLVRLGTSVIVVPQRNGVVMAKQLATLDSLSGGRVIAGVGVGWNEREFANLGATDRYHVRAPTSTRRSVVAAPVVRIVRAVGGVPHHPDFAFGPLPEQADLPIVVGGRDERALRRAARWVTATLERNRPGALRRADPGDQAAAAAGRPMPRSRRASGPFGDADTGGYAMRGSVDEIQPRCVPSPPWASPISRWASPPPTRPS
jgi:alkanesulfonate monooxygenase SsuD/methylene tetrahydromethanopterin reductase-like flavin-dependent oxidoreductase (luciferase family)